MEQQNLGIQDGSNDKKYFTIIPNYILNHSTAMDQALYCQLKRLTDEKGKDYCYPSVNYLTKQLKAGKKAIRKSIEYLEEHKWIENMGKRQINTRGGYQYVQCYKVNDIWQMNMEYYQKDKGGSNWTPLEENKGGLKVPKGGSKGTKGGSVVALYKEPLKKEHIKEEQLAITEVIAINPLIELFKDVNPSYKKLYANRTQRQALERMVKEHGPEKIKKMIEILPQTNKQQYCPIVCTPLQLEDKLGQILAFIQKKTLEKNNNKVLKI